MKTLGSASFLRQVIKSLGVSCVDLVAMIPWTG